MLGLQEASIDELLDRCRRKEDDACLELFRLAIVEEDEDAWQVVYNQYQLLVRKWLNAVTSVSDDEMQDLVQDAFLRFWGNAKKENFARSDYTMAQVQVYLRRCAQSAAIDAWRKHQWDDLIESSSSLEEKVIKKIVVEGVRERIAALLSTYSDEERLIFRLSYVMGLPPRKIVEYHPDLFENAKSVFRIKERIIKRLKNDPVLHLLKEG